MTLLLKDTLLKTLLIKIKKQKRKMLNIIKKCQMILIRNHLVLIDDLFFD